MEDTIGESDIMHGAIARAEHANGRGGWRTVLFGAGPPRPVLVPGQRQPQHRQRQRGCRGGYQNTV